MIGKTGICGFDISTGSLDEHLGYIAERIATETGAWIVTIHTEMLSRASLQQDYKNLLLDADLLVADGMPFVWAANYKNPGHRIPGRTTGVELVDKLLRRDNVDPFAVIGGTNPAATLRRYPGAREKCRYLFTGKVDLSDDQVDMFVRELKNAEADIVYLALGVPKQDALARRLRGKLPEIVLIGVGGTFEILSQEGSRAPLWMQNSGLEWLYRLAREPGRLWKRYLVEYPVGIYALLKDCLTNASKQ